MAWKILDALKKLLMNQQFYFIVFTFTSFLECCATGAASSVMGPKWHQAAATESMLWAGTDLRDFGFPVCIQPSHSLSDQWVPINVIIMGCKSIVFFTPSKLMNYITMLEAGSLRFVSSQIHIGQFCVRLFNLTDIFLSFCEDFWKTQQRIPPSRSKWTYPALVYYYL